MKFSVNAAALPGLAQLMDRRRHDLEDGRDYLTRYARIDAGQAGILNWIWGQHEKVVATVGDFLDRAAEGYAGPYATAVGDAATYYAQTDAGAAARLDATMTPTDDPGKHATGSHLADPSVNAAVFADTACPGANYTPPVQRYTNYDFTPLDTLSPTSDARDLIWKLTEIAVDMGLLDHPYDLLDEAVKPLAGDWTAFAGCGDVFHNLAGAVKDSSDCILSGVTKLGGVWTGNAADQCALGLSRFAGDLASAGGPLTATGDAYASTAEQIRAQGDTLAALLTILIDEATEAALDVATGGAAEGLQILTTLEDLVRTVMKMRRVIAAAWDIARSFVQTGQASTASLGIIGNNHPMPALAGTVPALPVK